MKRFKSSIIVMWLGVMISMIVLSGCEVRFIKHSPKDKQKIADLNAEIDRLKRLHQEETKDLEHTMDKLYNRLSTEIDREEVSVDMNDRGLVITLLTNILFPSGKAKISDDGKQTLSRLINVLTEEQVTQNIAIEGHTDNVPIKHSGYKSNWELSTARAMSVLHYLEELDIAPQRMKATGYGEYQPVESNNTSEGRQKNRRVEIVIEPEYSAKRIQALEQQQYDLQGVSVDDYTVK